MLHPHGMVDTFFFLYFFCCYYYKNGEEGKVIAGQPNSDGVGGL